MPKISKKSAAPAQASKKVVDLTATPGREIKYPEIECYLRKDEDFISDAECKEILGWREVEEGEFLFKDRNGKKIVCDNNLRNRPLYMSKVDELVQEHLQFRYKYNGEPLIIGKTGVVLNGQHNLIAVPLAEQDRTGKQAAHWKMKGHKGPIILEKMMVVGINEDDATINTMDTCKPRSLTDVIYRSDYFRDEKTNVRRQAARAMDYAIRFLWQRTGARSDVFAPKMTHSEALDFIARHSRLLAAVRHILTENVSKDHTDNISRWIGLGYASALLYLMAVSKSDIDEYRNADTPGETVLNFDFWDKARSFWSGLSRGASEEFKKIQEGFTKLANTSTTTGGTVNERASILCAAWDAYSKDQKIKPISLVLTDHYTTDDLGIRHLNTVFSVGGIDIGNPVPKTEEKGDKGKSSKDEDNEDDNDDGEEMGHEEEINEEKNDKVLLRKTTGDKRPAPNGRLGGLPVSPLVSLGKAVLPEESEEKPSKPSKPAKKNPEKS